MPFDRYAFTDRQAGGRHLAPVERALASMLGPDFVAVVNEPKLALDDLFPDELRHVMKAVEKRQAEFSTARVCARHALSQLGVAPCSLVPNADRSPVWPAGIVGSITHTAGCCAVAVARADRVKGIGIDIEDDTPLEADFMTAICTSAERSWLLRLDEDRRRQFSKVFFGAKEAVYKCQYAQSGILLDFSDVGLAIDPAARTFRVVALSGAAATLVGIASVEGCFGWAAGFVLATAILRP